MHSRLVLEIERAGESLAGRIQDDHGHDVPFVGWLGLGAALELLIGDPPAAAPPDAGRAAS